MTKLKFEDDLVVDEVVEEDDAAAIGAYDITSYPSDLTVSVVYDMFKNDDILIPEYQRNYVWSIKQASLLIESFLMGLPVPQVFFYIDESNKSLVIDGQQRILSVVYFLDGYFGTETQGKKQVFRLKLHERSPYANKRFTDLTDAQQRKLKAAVLRAINIRQLNPKGEPTSVYHIFERLNTGGTPLTPQEIRNCVFRGDIVRTLKTLNSDKSWRRILGKKSLDTHQKDLELVLRLFALAYYFDEYEKPMKEFLNAIMERNRSATSKEIIAFRDRFPKVAEAILSEMGEKPFHIRGPLNSSALDAVFATLLTAKKPFPDDLDERYEALKDDDDFVEMTSHNTSDLAVVKRRFELAAEFLLD